MTSKLGKRCLALKRQCNYIEKQNLKLMNRIYHIKRITKRAQKERKAIMSHLDIHGDNYRSFDSFFDTDVLKDSSMVKPTRQGRTNNERVGETMKGEIRKTVSTAHDSSKSTNAYLMFCQHARKDILDLHPRSSHVDVAKLLAEKWTKLKPKDKEEYYQLYEKCNNKQRVNMIDQHVRHDLKDFTNGEHDNGQRQHILSPNLGSFTDLQGNIPLPQIPSPTLVDVDNSFGISNIPSPSFR